MPRKIRITASVEFVPRPEDYEPECNSFDGMIQAERDQLEADGEVEFLAPPTRFRYLAETGRTLSVSIEEVGDSVQKPEPAQEPEAIDNRWEFVGQEVYGQEQRDAIQKSYEEKIAEQEKEIERLKSRLTSLGQGLVEFGGHTDSCKAVKEPDLPFHHCTCGFREKIRMIPDEKYSKKFFDQNKSEELKSDIHKIIEELQG